MNGAELIGSVAALYLQELLFTSDREGTARFKVDPFVKTGGRAVLRATLLLFLPSYFLF